ncbi:MAG: ribosome maturation factor RimM [Burkholderiales bacterium]|nr:ribosome maturation factor RimM [Burkholderiales bacterium]MDP2397189.1 ribosome maturation factor RimM [Burkholderiales bacterium]
MNSKPLPERLVAMGRVIAPYGVKGWVKVQPFTQQPQSLLDYHEWQLQKGDASQAWAVDAVRVHGSAVVAKLQGIDDRDQAAMLSGMQVAVSRNEFPELVTGEYYWADLVGLTVWNEAGIALGRVARVFETGANDVLVVEGARERLLPFIGPVVRQVDVAGGRIVVDWDADY